MYKGLLTKFTGFITYKTCELDKQNQHQNLVCQVWSKKILNSTLISCCSALSLVSRHCPLQSCCESPPYSPPPVNNAFMFRFSARGALKCFNWRHLDDISPPSALLLPQLEKSFRQKLKCLHTSTWLLLKDMRCLALSWPPLVTRLFFYIPSLISNEPMKWSWRRAGAWPVPADTRP